MNANEYTAGDLVEAIKGETVTRGRLKADGDYLWVGDSGRTPENLESYGFTLSLIEKAAAVVVLPTEPGAYGYAGWSDILILNSLGEWHNQWASRIDVTALENSGLTRLEPVSETAKKVLDRVRSVFYGDSNVDRHLEMIAADFGVTK